MLPTIAGPGSRLYTQAEGGGGGGGDRLVGDEYWAMDLEAENYGFTGPFSYTGGAEGMDLDEVSVTYNATGGPNNRPYLAFVIQDDPDVPAEFSTSFPINPAPVTVGYGDTVYVRFSARVNTHGSQTQKFLQWNTLTGNQRVVIVLQGNWGEYCWRICEDGGLWAQTDGGSWTGTEWSIGENGQNLGVWYDVQFRITFASGPSTNDGSVAIYLNNDNVNAPDAIATGLDNIVPDLESGTMDWIGYHQANVDANLPRPWDATDIRIGPTFDSNWHATGAGA